MLSEKSYEHFEEKVAYLSCLRQKQDFKALTSVAFSNSSLIPSVAKQPLLFQLNCLSTFIFLISRLKPSILRLVGHLAMPPWALLNVKLLVTDPFLQLSKIRDKYIDCFDTVKY